MMEMRRKDDEELKRTRDPVSNIQLACYYVQKLSLSLGLHHMKARGLCANNLPWSSRQVPPEMLVHQSYREEICTLGGVPYIFSSQDQKPRLAMTPLSVRFSLRMSSCPEALYASLSGVPKMSQCQKPRLTMTPLSVRFSLRLS